MKKILFLAALAATMASCTNEVGLDVSKSYAIGFDTYVGKTTRAGDLNTSSLTSFYVYGGTSALEFKGTQVTKQNDVWTYYPMQYWEENAKYKFAAVAPVNKDASYDYASGKLTVANYAGGDDDLIVATTNEITGKASGSNSLVGLNFKHALSKVQISFSGLDASKTLSDVKINNVSNKATLEVGYNAGTAPSWGATSATGNYGYTVSATTGKGVKYLLPQTLADNTTITYTYDGKPVSLNIKTADVAAWEMGKAYNYNITLSNENAIGFEVTVTEWPTIGDEPTQTEPETPEEPTDDPTEEPSTEVPSNIIITSNKATWVRSNNESNKNYNAESVEVKYHSDGYNFYGLLGFEMPANIKKNGYKLSASLRLVNVQCKGDRNVDLYEYVGDTFDYESATYGTIGSGIEASISNNPILTFETKGQGTKAMGDDKLTNDYKEVSSWTNNLDFTNFITNKVSSADNGSYLTLIIKKTNTHNDSMKFATGSAVDIHNTKKDSEGNAMDITFKAEDLVPQLVITYEKE